MSLTSIRRTDHTVPTTDEQERRARIRRNAVLFGLVALAFYLGFILMGYLRS